MSDPNNNKTNLELDASKKNIGDIISQFLHHKDEDSDDEHECCSCPEHMKR